MKCGFNTIELKEKQNKSNELAEESDIQRYRARRETKHIQELLNKYYNEQQNNKKA